MPKSFSKTRTQNAQLIAHWKTRDESVFSGLGISRETICETQTQLSGYIVLPGDPSYDTDRMPAYIGRTDSKE